MTQRLRVETHCHTIYSKDSLTSPESLLVACKKKGIDRIIITDHNTIRGAVLAYDLDPQKVIVGEEIKTTEGELLAFFVKEEVPAGLKPLEAIQYLRAQNAFISVSHPFDSIRNGHWEVGVLFEITPLVDAIEIFNSRCLSAADNDRVIAFAKEHGLPGTVGSDAHHPSEIGRSALWIPPFHDADSFRKALRDAEYETKLSPPWVHFFSGYANWRKSKIKGSLSANPLDLLREDPGR
jgi:predicted metal-dependent phosphoesterase TrpH